MKGKNEVWMDKNRKAEKDGVAVCGGEMDENEGKVV